MGINLFQKAKKNFSIKELAGKELENRYPQAPFRKEIPGLRKKIAEEGFKNLELMRKVSGRPQGISYYEEIISTEVRERELKDFPGKIIGSFCIFTPEELIYAAGALPVRLCASSYDTIAVAEEVLPRDICPLVKSSFGFKVAGLSYFELCDVVITPTPCDDKKKLGGVLSDYVTTWVLRLPQTKDLGYSREYWLREIRILKERLEELTGNKITKKRLRESIRLLHRRQAVWRRLYELRKHDPPLINGRDSLLIAQASFYDDLERWIKNTEKLCQELERQRREGPVKSLGANGAGGGQKMRLLLTGAPLVWPNFKLLNMIEEMRAIIVIDELCSGTRHLYDPVEVDEWTEEGMLAAIANRYLLPTSCPCFTEGDDRLDKLFQAVEDFRVEGVVHHSLRLCPLYDMELPRVSRVFKDKGIPFLSIHTDYSLEDVEQLRTRMEAFLEIIR